MFDHVTLGIADLERSRAFYDAALKPLGIARYPGGGGGFAGYGIGGKGKGGFWIGLRDGPVSPVHIAFAAADRATVDAFYAAALAAGARDNGAPGLRPQYHAGYYGAFVLDPDGHNIEAVCHRG